MDNNNIRLFVDMDGTLAKWNNVEFEQLFEKGYYRNLKPNEDLVSEVNRLIDQGENIYILSCVLPESKYALEEKKEWLREYVPNLPEDKYIFVPYGQNKADYLKEHYSPITNHDYLIDDYTQNLQEWKEYGGIGVKYLNGINHTRGTWKGLMIYDSKAYSHTLYEDNLSVGLIDLLIAEKLKAHDIMLIGSFLGYGLGYGAGDRNYICIYDSKFYYIDRVLLGIKNEENITIDYTVNTIQAEVKKSDSFIPNVAERELMEQFYERHYPTLSKRRDVEKIIHALDYNTLDNIEYTLSLLETGKVTFIRTGEYTIDEGINNLRISIDSIYWEMGIIDTEDLIKNIKSDVKDHSSLNQGRKSMKERLNEAQNKAQQKNDQSKERNQQDRSGQVL